MDIRTDCLPYNSFPIQLLVGVSSVSGVRSIVFLKDAVELLDAQKVLLLLCSLLGCSMINLLEPESAQ